MNELNQYCM